MADVKVNFGGTVNCTWETLQEVVTTYLSIATEYGLTTVDFGLRFDRGSDDRVLSGVLFFYEKTISESGLQTFNDEWANIATQYSIVRESTTINYL